jgi:hypothetical protein
LVRVPRTSEKQYWPPVLRTITRVQRTNFCGMFQIHQRLHPVCGTKAAFVAAASTPLIGTLVGSTVLDSCFRVTPCAWSKVQWLPDGRIAAAGCIPVLSRERNTAPPFEQYQRGLHILGIRGRTWNGGSVLVGGGELPAAQRTKAAPDHLFAFAR